jgi:hypothetical protein
MIDRWSWLGEAIALDPGFDHCPAVAGSRSGLGCARVVHWPHLRHRERIVIDCRNGQLSPAAGLVERGYAQAVAAKACRLAGEPA